MMHKILAAMLLIVLSFGSLFGQQDQEKDQKKAPDSSKTEKKTSQETAKTEVSKPKEKVKKKAKRKKQRKQHHHKHRQAKAKKKKVAKKRTPANKVITSLRQKNRKLSNELVASQARVKKLEADLKKADEKIAIQSRPESSKPAEAPKASNLDDQKGSEPVLPKMVENLKRWDTSAPWWHLGNTWTKEHGWLNWGAIGARWIGFSLVLITLILVALMIYRKIVSHRSSSSGNTELGLHEIDESSPDPTETRTDMAEPEFRTTGGKDT